MGEGLPDLSEVAEEPSTASNSMTIADVGVHRSILLPGPWPNAPESTSHLMVVRIHPAPCPGDLL